LIQTFNPVVPLMKGVGIGFAIAAPVGPIVAAFGLTAISNFLVGQRAGLGLVGGLFLCYLGIRTFRSKPAEVAAPVRSGGLMSAYLSTVFLTLTNPMTILSFVMLFASLGLGTAPDYFTAGITVVGVFVGSTLWWVLLSSGVARFRSRVTPRWMQAINPLSGCVILAFGLYSILRFLFR